MKRLFKTVAAIAVATSVSSAAFASDAPTPSKAVQDWNTKVSAAMVDLLTPSVQNQTLQSIIHGSKSEVDAAMTAATTPRTVTYNFKHRELSGNGTSGGAETTTAGSTGSSNYSVQEGTVQKNKTIVTLGDDTDWQKVINAVRKYATGAEGGQLASIQLNDPTHYSVDKFSNPSAHTQCTTFVPTHHLSSTHGSDQKNNWGVVGEILAYSEENMYKYNCFEAKDLESAKSNIGSSTTVEVSPTADKGAYHGTALDAMLEANKTIDDYIKVLALLHNRPAELNR